jgi:hypothetical protein
LLVLTLPAAVAFKTDEFRDLEQWTRAGNTVLILAALSDSPEWAAALSGLTASDLGLLTGLELGAPRSRSHQTSPHLQRADLIPNGPHAYFMHVHRVVALSDYLPQVWHVKLPYEGFVLALAHEGETGEGVLWVRPVGAGRVLVSAFGSIFTNRALGLADNARFFANLVGASLGAGGVVLFDDVHQGLSAVYDPESFYRDPRLYLTLGVLVLLWLSWVVGAGQLRLPTARVAAPRELELVLAAGGFLARTLTPAAAAMRLFKHFLRRFSWEALERHPRIASADLRQLRGWYVDAQASRRVPVARLYHLMSRLNEQLSA